MNYTELFFKFFKFGLVGVSGTAVDFGVTYFFKEWVKLNKYIANSIGFTVAVTTNYLLNRIFTFQSQGDMTAEYFKFLLIGIIGMGLNNLFIYLFEKRFGLNFYVAKIAATLIVMVWNFGGSLLFAFK